MKTQIPTLKIIAENVKAYRLAKDISQEKLAEIADVHRNYIGHVERAERNMTIDSIERIAKALGVTIIALLTPPNQK
ncbi:MAG: helix-turn-helix domain-containing protein [Burkholderiales bacterium]|jgi:transcriptional regulator with XRE-family HTH domain|nr:helix-turn-helix domain-containing protein [Burkholderiales bacterium]